MGCTILGVLNVQKDQTPNEVPVDFLQNEALIRLDDALARVVSDSGALRENKSKRMKQVCNGI